MLGLYGSPVPEEAPAAADRRGDLRHQSTDGPLRDAFDGLVEDTLQVEISSLAAEITAHWGSVELLRCLFTAVGPERFKPGGYNLRVMAGPEVTMGFTLRTVLTLHEAGTGARMEGRDLDAAYNQAALYRDDVLSAGVG